MYRSRYGREEFGCKSTLQYSLDHKALFLEPYCIQETPVTLRGASLPEKLEPWCVEVSRVSGSVEQCRGSVGAVSVDTGVGCRAVSGCSVEAVSRLLDSGDVRVVSRCQAVSKCRSVGVSGCRTGVEVSRCRCHIHKRQAISLYIDK